MRTTSASSGERWPPREETHRLPSLDVEGAEFEVLKTIDFTAQQFGVIFYEADPHNVVKNEIVKSYLEARGYTFREHALRSNFHVNERFHDIYAHVAYES